MQRRQRIAHKKDVVIRSDNESETESIPDATVSLSSSQACDEVIVEPVKKTRRGRFLVWPVARKPKVTGILRK